MIESTRDTHTSVPEVGEGGARVGEPRRRGALGRLGYGALGVVCGVVIGVVLTIGHRDRFGFAPGFVVWFGVPLALVCLAALLIGAGLYLVERSILWGASMGVLTSMIVLSLQSSLFPDDAASLIWFWGALVLCVVVPFALPNKRLRGERE